MKKFVISVLSIAVFFAGLGSLAERVGAQFKSDQKAMEIIGMSRAALGGEAALAQVRSMVITGRTIHQFKVDGAERSETGETEIAIQFPDKMTKSVKMGNPDGTASKTSSTKHEVYVTSEGGPHKVRVAGENGEFTTTDGKKIIIEKADAGEFTTQDGKNIVIHKGEGGKAVFTGQDGKSFEIKTVPGGNGEFVTEDGKRVVVRTSESADSDVWVTKDGDGKHVSMARSAGGGMFKRNNELVRLALSLLLTAPEGMPVSYRFVGEADVDGIPVNVIAADAAGSTYKLYIGKSNNLPLAVSYVGMPGPMMVRFSKEGASPEEMAKDHVTFTKKVHAMEPVETTVRLTEYRSAGTVLLPYKWTSSSEGSVKEVFEVTSYDINPANIAERFANQKVFVRTAKPDGQ
ncbi:MAG: hypothetical protein IPM25_16590 [Chloracidobacterium sp.]|nr:hypothetical protein [Chloracidobacterium sp.]